MDEGHLDDLRRHAQQRSAWGSERFQQQIEAPTWRAVGARPRGEATQANRKSE